MITGETNINACDGKSYQCELMRVAKRCAMFSPKDRYPTVDDVRSALLAIKSPQRRMMKRLAWAFTIFAALALVVITVFSQSKNTVHFSEPGLEQAARLALDIGPREPLNRAALAQIRELYLFGDQAAKNPQEYSELIDLFIENNPTLKRGTMRTLADLKFFPNLRIGAFGFQRLKNIDGVVFSPELTKIDLRNNPTLTDSAPIGKLRMIESVTLFETNIRNITDLRNCPRLFTLDIGMTQIGSFSELEGFTTLEELLARRLPPFGLAPLLDLPSLKTAYLDEERRIEVEKLHDKTTIHFIFE